VTWTYTPYAGVLHATTVISALIGFLALRRRKTPGGGILALLMFAVAEWAFASGLEAAAVGIPSKIFWSKIEYLGSLSAPTLFLLFALEYSQKKSWRKPIYLTLLSIVPIIGFIVTATQWHGLIWSSLTPDPALPNVLIYGHGIGYYILIVYDYLIISTGIVALVNEWFHSKQPFHRQVGILLLGSLFPFAAGLIYTLFPKFLPGLDLTPVSFSLTDRLWHLKIPVIQPYPSRPGRSCRKYGRGNSGIGCTEPGGGYQPGRRKDSWYQWRRNSWA
jgi:hypothetical protein